MNKKKEITINREKDFVSDVILEKSELIAKIKLKKSVILEVL